MNTFRGGVVAKDEHQEADVEEYKAETLRNYTDVNVD